MKRERYLPGILAVAATYAFFLLFAQFAFLDILRLRLGGEREVEGALAAMGFSGLAASLGAARLLRRVAARRLLASGFAACAASTLVALAAYGRPALTAAAVAIGVSTAAVTVALAVNLRCLVPGRRFGVTVGTGTGLAYLFCNLPAVFEGSPAFQGALAAGVCLVGLGAALAARESPRETVPERPALARSDFFGWGFASVVVSFLALIWLDSAAFAVIQESIALKAQTWGEGGQKLVQGGVHFAAAVAAGWLIDRGLFRSLLLATFGLFAASFLLLGGQLEGFLTLAGPLYALGISLYSVALVAYPSYRGDEPGLVPRSWRAAVVFGVAGWLGSALGVGMAQSLHRIPNLFLAVVGALLLVGWALGQPAAAALLRSHAWTLVAAGAGAAVYAVHPVPVARAGASAVDRGRQVYVAEGCIHCHSQYVRPRSADVELWGPRRDAAAGERPPLYGNRRQGPDLTNAGSRRSAAWHRLHLRDPRAVVPTSRMPSYAHLFAAGSRRGDDLVAYLASLGADAGEEWYEITRRAEIAGAARGGSAARGEVVFHTFCAPCHGAEGRGDGPLAPALYRPAMNLRKGGLWLVSWGPGAEPVEEGLARLVKYGVPGTSMPGHEYLSDRQLADLVAFVGRLSGAAEPRPASSPR